MILKNNRKKINFIQIRNDTHLKVANVRCLSQTSSSSQNWIIILSHRTLTKNTRGLIIIISFYTAVFHDYKFIGLPILLESASRVDDYTQDVIGGQKLSLTKKYEIDRIKFVTSASCLNHI